MTTENYLNIELLHFTPHLRWDRRGEAPPAAGVYAISKDRPENLIYVGLTRQTKGLRGRLRQFHRSATTGRHGHAGGVTYYQLFGPNTSGLLFATHLAEVPSASPKIMAAYVHYAERTLIWQHIARHGELPVCNSA